MISVIVPVYNVQDYLCACIDSVLKQSYKDFELLLVDDGSTDQSGKICDEYARRDQRVRVFHKENGGVCSARNVGLDHMRGDFCLLVDSDDVIHPDLMARSKELISNYPCECVIYNYKKVEEDFTLCNAPWVNQGPIEHMTRDQAFSEILSGKRFRMLAWNKLYKSSLWEGIRFPEDRSFGDDTSVTYKLIGRCSNVIYTSAPMYYYRDRAGSALHKRISEKNLQLFDAYNELLDYVGSECQQHMGEAADAYLVRMFDLFARLRTSKIAQKEKVRLLNLLRNTCSGKRKLLLKKARMTVKQRVLVRLFFQSPVCFWRLYRMSCR